MLLIFHIVLGPDNHHWFQFGSFFYSYGHDGWSTMIILAQHQHGGSFLRIAWDPRILVGDSVTVDTKARAIFFSHDTSSLIEKYIYGLIELLQH